MYKVSREKIKKNIDILYKDISSNIYYINQITGYLKKAKNYGDTPFEIKQLKSEIIKLKIRVKQAKLKIKQLINKF